jgi:hypothetical protein
VTTTQPRPEQAAPTLVDSLAAVALLLTGLGAVLLTYLGLKEFRPATIPEGSS